MDATLLPPWLAVAVSAAAVGTLLWLVYFDRRG